MMAPRHGLLITGATGYFGQAMVRRAIADGVQRVCIYSRSEINQARMRAELGDPASCRWFIGDVRDQTRLERAMASVEYVIHAAALKRVEVGEYNPEEMVRTNVEGTQKVIAAALATHPHHVVLLSTDKAYQPINTYGATKFLAERLTMAANLYHTRTAFSVVRYGNVMGSTGSVVKVWREALAAGKPLHITDPECTRFWMTDAEAVEFARSALDSPAGHHHVWNGPRAFRLGDLLLAITGSQGWKQVVTGLPDHEKRHETLRTGLSSDTAYRMSIEEIKRALADT